MSKDLTEQYEVGGTPICKEGSYVYTENGIEKVHYCQVGCITERVTPKANILAPVPSYEEWEKLNWYAGNGVEENQELKMENAHLKELLKDARNVLKMVDTYCGDNDSINGFLIVEKIDEVLNVAKE